MKLIIKTALVWFCLITRTFALAPGDSTVYSALHQLTDKLHLKEPKLRKDEYEVRIWQREQLVFGPAQVVYILKKTAKNVRLTKYQIHFDKPNFQRFTHIKPVRRIDSTFWNRLVKQDILTMPDDSAIENRLRPKPKKDSTRVTIESDGSIAVKANKKAPRFMISDGQTYYFEVFSADSHREYSYHNPVAYLSAIQLPELQKVVAILDELSTSFQYAP